MANDPKKQEAADELMAVKTPADFEEAISDRLKVKPPPDQPAAVKEKAGKRTDVKDSHDR